MEQKSPVVAVFAMYKLRRKQPRQGNSTMGQFRNSTAAPQQEPWSPLAAAASELRSRRALRQSEETCTPRWP